jgi:uncharacterized protein with GYD domain
MIVLPEGAGKDDCTYIYLIKDVEGTPKLTAAQRKKEINDVNDFVKKEGGVCHLYSTPGAALDFVSIITGIGPAAAMRIASEIGKRGTVKATLIPATEVFDTPPRGSKER